MKVFDRSIVVLEIGFEPGKATLLGTFFNVDKAPKDDFLGIMLEIWKHASSLTELGEAVKSLPPTSYPSLLATLRLPMDKAINALSGFFAGDVRRTSAR